MVAHPVEPPPTRWDFGGFHPEAGDDLVGVGGDLRAGTILAAYRHGLFPMGLGHRGRAPLGWWSPDPRGVLLPGGFHASRSLRRSARRMEIRVDTAFTDVVSGCADARRPGRWITADVEDAYVALYRLGWAHSVEAWVDGELAGGLYGLGLGGLFAAESKFHRRTDASKVAVLGLVRWFFADGDPRRLIDVQWRTPHLASLGVVELSRAAYLRRLAVALTLESPSGADLRASGVSKWGHEWHPD